MDVRRRHSSKALLSTLMLWPTYSLRGEFRATANSSLHKARSFGICVGRCVRYPLLHMSDCTEMTVHDLL